MQNRTVMKLCIVLCAASFAGSASGYIKTIQRKKIELPQMTISQTHPFMKIPQTSTKKSDSNITHGYIVKNDNGYITVYVDNGEQTPVIYKKYDIAVSTLPLTDREELETGIKKETLSDVLELIEDFSS